MTKEEREKVVLAFAIASAQSALDHMYALRKVGRYVPVVVVNSLKSELFFGARQWLVIDDEFIIPDSGKAVIEARAFLAETQNQKHLDELLTEREKVETSGR